MQEDYRLPTLTKVNQASSQRRFSRKIGSKIYKKIVKSFHDNLVDR